MSTTKERSIIFSAAMVQALLAGRKTQTRRMLKPQPKFDFQVRYDGPGFDDPLFHYWERLEADGDTPTEDYLELCKCPYGAPGDQLWVRESYTLGVCPKDLQAAPQLRRGPVSENVDWCLAARYDGDPSPGGWFTPHGHKPAIHMPRWASRITLELLEVRVERLQDISEADAIAEGIMPNWCGDMADFVPEEHGYLPWMPKDGEEHIEGADIYETWGTAKEAYSFLWDSLHGEKPGESWKDNPWVWVLTFKKIEEGQDK